MRKLSFFTVLLVLILAIPAFAVDGTLLSPIVSGSYGNTGIFNNKAIYGNYVAWQDVNNVIYLYDVEKKTTTEIGQGFRPNIYGDVVIWADSSLNGNVVKYDISTGTKVQLGNEGNAIDSHRPSIQGNKIVWSRSTDSVIQIHDIFTGQTTSLPAIGENATVYGDKLAYTRGSALYMYSVKNSIETLVAPNTVIAPMIDGTYIYWSAAGTDIKTYNISSGTVDTILMNTNFQSPNVFEGKVYFDINPAGAIACNGNYFCKVYQLDTRNKVLSVLYTHDAIEQWASAVYKNKVILSSFNGGTGIEDIRIFDITAPNEEIYSLDTAGNTVTVIHPYEEEQPIYTAYEDARVVGTITTGAGPSAAGLSPDGTKLYVLNSTDKTVTIAQTYDFMSVNTIAVNPTSKQTATSVAGDDNSNVYVALKFNNGNAGIVKKIPATGTPIELTVGINPNSLKIAPDGKTLFVSNGDSGYVIPIDVATFTIKSYPISRGYPNNTFIITGAGTKLIKP